MTTTPKLAPDYIERLRLIQTLSGLPNSQFEELLFALKAPSGVLFSSPAPQGQRSSELLKWAEGPTGPNLSKLQHILDEILGLSRELATGQCPYKGLSYFDFNDQDYKYFYGRESLTQNLLEKVETSNFMAIVGASGSGKSSVLRAGLLQQLKHSDRYEIRILKPEGNPLQNLALAFVDKSQLQIRRSTQQKEAEKLLEDGADGLRRLVQNSDSQRVILVVDQFEEAFTLCQESTLRQQFFETLLGALKTTNDRLCVILAMRSDFVGRCFEQSYGGLADQVQNNLVAVLPMKPSELDKAITGPATSVGLDIESELVKQLLDDVESSPGNLPLLQYTLQELWKQRQSDTLELKTYVHLGGVTRTLQKRANEVYNALDPKQQQTARHIFLSLTQPGEGSEDTRRRVPQRSLVTAQHAEFTVAAVVKKLADANLIVTNEVISGTDASRVAVVDVAHEALIRHWDQLRNWLDKSREALLKQRNIENAFRDWVQHDYARDYLLQGSKLSEAEHYLKDYSETLGLSNQAQDLIQKSRRRRRNSQFGWVSLSSGIFTLFILFLYWSSIQNQNESVMVWESTNPKHLHVLPRALKTANQQVKIGNRKEAMESYKEILLAANRFAEAAKTNSSEFEDSDLQRIEEITKASEQQRSKIIAQYHLPDLERDLENHEFGRLYSDEEIEMADYEEKFTEGALKTTNRILMSESGLRADLNQNGRLDLKEKNLIPCETLRAIETLWRRHTNNRCGFHENGDYYISESCHELSTYTLTVMIFSHDHDFAVKRLNACGVLELNNEIK